MKMTPESGEFGQSRQALPVPVRYPKQLAPKLGLIVNLEFIMAVAQRDHAAPQPPRMFTLEQLVAKVARWTAEELAAYCMVESCGFRFELHWQLLAVGEQSFLITPIALNSLRKTDNLNAYVMSATLALAGRQSSPAFADPHFGGGGAAPARSQRKQRDSLESETSHESASAILGIDSARLFA
jgi:hypothetical protein